MTVVGGFELVREDEEEREEEEGGLHSMARGHTESIVAAKRLNAVRNEVRARRAEDSFEHVLEEFLNEKPKAKVGA